MNKEVHHKLLHFEAPPSLELWNKITNRLDADPEYLVSKKMIRYESTPVPEAWDSIVTRLDQDKLVANPSRSKYVSFRYLSAAAILLACAVLISLYTIRQAENKTFSAFQKQNESGTRGQEHGIVSYEVGEMENKGEEKIAGFTTPPVPGKKNYALRLYTLPPRKSSSSIRNKLAKELPRSKPLVAAQIVDRYIIFPKATGDAVRLSKKLFGLFACSERDVNCREDINTLQQKMASGTMMASTDFTGILEALHTMNKE